MAAPPDTAALIDPVAASNKENGEGMGMAIPGRINATKHAPNGHEVVPLELPEFDMFSTRKPRNLIAGTSSGLKSVVKGVVGGTVGLIATPIVRAHQVCTQTVIPTHAHAHAHTRTLTFTLTRTRTQTLTHTAAYWPLLHFHRMDGLASATDSPRASSAP